MAQAEEIPPMGRAIEVPHNDDNSDNESVISENEPDNTQQLTQLKNELKDEMGSIARQVKETVLSLNEGIQQKFSALDSQHLQTQMRVNHNNNQGNIHLRNSTPMQTFGVPVSQSLGVRDNDQMAPRTINFNLPESHSQSSSATSQSNSVKLKPQTYSGTEDEFEDFLTQFEITSEINNWDYRAKSLYLANCLTVSARTLLNELTAEKRRDYSNLVQKLMERNGSENRAEVFRSRSHV